MFWVSFSAATAQTMRLFMFIKESQPFSKRMRRVFIYWISNYITQHIFFHNFTKKENVAQKSLKYHENIKKRRQLNQEAAILKMTKTWLPTIFLVQVMFKEPSYKIKCLSHQLKYSLFATVLITIYFFHHFLTVF